MARRARRITIAAFALGAVVIAIETAAWWWLTNQVAAQFEAWAAFQRENGLQVTTGLAHRSGWPFEAASVVPDVTVATAGGASWHTGELRLLFQPWHPAIFAAIPTGPQLVRFGSSGAITVTAQTMVAAIPLQPTAATITSVQAHGVAARWGSQAGTQTLAAERLNLRLNATDFELAATEVALPKPPPGQAALPFGGVIESVGLHARNTVPLPLASDWLATLQNWQRLGGQLQLSGLALHWGALEALGSATVHLTPGLQPDGAGSVQVTGFNEAIGALQRSGTLSRDSARVASAVFALLAKQVPGAPPEVDLPVTLQDGVLSAGPVPLLRIPNFMLR